MRGSTLIAVRKTRPLFYFVGSDVKWFHPPYPFTCLTAKGKLSEKPKRRYLSLPSLL